MTCLGPYILFCVGLSTTKAQCIFPHLQFVGFETPSNETVDICRISEFIPGSLLLI